MLYHCHLFHTQLYVIVCLLLLLDYYPLSKQVGVGGGMKSGVAFWRALRDVRDIHPCWAHLNGQPLKEHDLPRPISTEYKSIFDMPSGGAAEQHTKVRKVVKKILKMEVTVTRGMFGGASFLYECHLGRLSRKHALQAPE